MGTPLGVPTPTLGTLVLSCVLYVKRIEFPSKKTAVVLPQYMVVVLLDRHFLLRCQHFLQSNTYNISVLSLDFPWHLTFISLVGGDYTSASRVLSADGSVPAVSFI